MSKVTLIDYSEQVKDMLQSEKVAWLHTWASEITAQAQRNCKMDDKGQLRGSYSNYVDEQKGEATIGTPLEAGYWEEFGTGEHAVDTSKSRSGWWVYTPGNPGPADYESMTYMDETEATAMARHIEKKYGHKAVATNGRKPQHTLENAFKVTVPKMEADLQDRMNNGKGG